MQVETLSLNLRLPADSFTLEELDALARHAGLSRDDYFSRCILTCAMNSGLPPSFNDAGIHKDESIASLTVKLKLPEDTVTLEQLDTLALSLGLSRNDYFSWCIFAHSLDVMRSISESRAKAWMQAASEAGPVNESLLDYAEDRAVIEDPKTAD